MPSASISRRRARLALVVLAAAGCAEKFDLPPVPEVTIPEPGAYNYDRQWPDMGAIRDLYLRGSRLFTLTERGGELAIEGYLSTVTAAVPIGFLGDEFRGMRSPTEITFQGDYVYVADQRGPDLLELSVDGAALECRSTDGGADEHIIGRAFPDQVEQDFQFSARVRVDALPPSGVATLVLGTETGAPAIWLRYTDDGLLRPVRSDGAFPVDSIAVAPGEWHEVVVRHDWELSEYSVTVDDSTFTEGVPVYFPVGTELLTEPIGAMALRLSGEGTSAALSDISLRVDEQLPGAIDALTLDPIDASSIRMSWIAPGDDGDTGRVDRYDIRWAPESTEVDGAESRPGPPSPLPAGEMETFTLVQLGGADSVYAKIRGIDESGNAGPYSPTVAVAVTGGGPAVTARHGNSRTVPDVLFELDFADGSEIDAWTQGVFFPNEPSPAILRYTWRDGGDPDLIMTNPTWYAIHGLSVDIAGGVLWASVDARVAADPSGVVRETTVRALTASGDSLSVPAASGSGAGFVSGPRGLDFDEASPLGASILAVDEQLNRVQLLDPDGANETRIEIPAVGSSDAFFNAPTDVVTDLDSFIYVADTGNDQVLRFSPEGAFTDTVFAPAYPPSEGAGDLVAPSAIEADEDEVWIADPVGERIVIFKRAGSISGGTP